MGESKEEEEGYVSQLRRKGERVVEDIALTLLHKIDRGDLLDTSTSGTTPHPSPLSDVARWGGEVFRVASRVTGEVKCDVERRDKKAGESLDC